MSQPSSGPADLAPAWAATAEQAAAWTIALLWRHKDRAGASDSAGTQPSGAPERPQARPRGPRPSLTVDRVIEVAIGVADGEGAAAVTMRRVARELGVSTMTLYTYVPGKAELLELMLDTIYAAMPRTSMRGEPWRRRVAAVAHDNHALYQCHPWAASISVSRPPLGPGLMAKYEHELSAFAGLGLDDLDMDAALTFLLGFVQAAARASAQAAAVERDSEMNDEQWWVANEPWLARIVDATAFPTAARVGAAAGAARRGAFSPNHAYEFGLRRIIDGLGMLIDGDRRDSARVVGSDGAQAR